MKQVIAVPLAIVFLLLGVIGIVLPVLQGGLFIAIGFILLAKHYPPAVHRLERMKAKGQTIKKIVECGERWVDSAEYWLCKKFPVLASEEFIKQHSSKE